MTRADFGGTPGDTVWDKNPDGTAVFSSATITCWSDQYAGVQYNDLQLGGVQVSEIPVGDDAQIPVFQGPDNVTVLWISANLGPRAVLRAAGAGATGGGGGGGTDTIAVDTDGVPYFKVNPTDTPSTSRRLVSEAAQTTALAGKLSASVFAAYGERPKLYASTSTGAWPSRTVPAGYSGPVTWDSVDYERSSGSAASAPSGAIDGDRWKSKL